jgi:hypothetical protein
LYFGDRAAVLNVRFFRTEGVISSLMTWKLTNIWVVLRRRIRARYISMHDYQAAACRASYRMLASNRLVAHGYESCMEQS